MFPDLWSFCSKTVTGEEEAQTEPCDGDSPHDTATFFLFFVGSRKERKRQAGSGFLSKG